MNELWGLLNILDNAEDVALFVVDERDEKILYCNHYVTLMTNAHPGSDLSLVWSEEDYKQAVAHCGLSENYHYYADHTRFGARKNVTVSKVVWSAGKRAFAFLLTNHVDDEEEEEREKIFAILGRSYLNMYLVDIRHRNVTELLGEKRTSEWEQETVYHHPVDFGEWKRDVVLASAHPEDRDLLAEYLEPNRILENLEKGDYAFQYRKGIEEYRWTEMRFQKLRDIGIAEKIVCTERDVDGEIALNRKEKENKAILASLSNIFRSVYLLNLEEGTYETVKEDKLLFGIPGNGDYQTLQDIVLELIPDRKQKRDFKKTFELSYLDKAFDEYTDHVGREYNSSLNSELNWMSVIAFRPPYMQGMEDKCLLTFRDITEHKRVEAERDEKGTIVDVLSSRYAALIFANFKEDTYHSLRIPKKYGYVEKQYPSLSDAMMHYGMAYTLSRYKDIFKTDLIRTKIEERKDNRGKNSCLEFIYRTVEDRWIRMTVFLLSGEAYHDEAVIAIEDYDDIVEQHALSIIYNTTLLSDYEAFYEYNPEDDEFYDLTFEGGRPVRKKRKRESLHSEGFNLDGHMHPDDLALFRQACSKEVIEKNFLEGKNVAHLCLRRKVGDTYVPYHYGLHYYEGFGKQRVLITRRAEDQ